MSTLIIYATKHGCTEKCAKILKEELTGKVELHNLKEAKAPDLTQYDKVVIGGSIYIGTIQKEVKEFCASNLSFLKHKKVGLFICGMQTKEALDTEFNNAFPKDLLNIAVAKECFGGEFIFKKMNFMEKLIVKKVSKIENDTSNISSENIKKFAELMNAVN